MLPRPEMRGTIQISHDIVSHLQESFEDLADEGILTWDLSAEFTKDMIETLSTFFGAYAKDGMVTIEVTNRGLWLPNPFGGRQFLGLARLPQGEGHGRC